MLFPMPDARMTGQAVGRLIAVRMVNGDDEIAVTMETGLLGHRAVRWNDPNRVGDIAQSKCLTVAKAVRCLDPIMADEVVRGMTVVASGDRVMGTAIPTIIHVAHHMAVGAGGGVIGQVGVALGIDKGKTPETHDAAGDEEKNKPRPKGKTSS